MPFADINGARLHYVDAGSGPPVLFVHGFPLDATLWDDQVASLARSHRCLAVDLRGFGRSAGPVPEALTMDAHASDLAELLDGLDTGPVALAGLSMGGYVALAMWELFPHLIGALALVNTRSGADTDEGKAGRDAAAAALVATGRQAWAAGTADALLAPGAGVAARARFLQMAEGTPYPTIVAALMGMKARPDRTGLLGSIAVPTLVVAGADDTLTPPSDAEAMASAVPDAELVVIPGAGHLTPIERPDDVTAALEGWLA